MLSETLPMMVAMVTSIRKAVNQPEDVQFLITDQRPSVVRGEPTHSPKSFGMAKAKLRQDLFITFRFYQSLKIFESWTYLLPAEAKDMCYWVPKPCRGMKEGKV